MADESQLDRIVPVMNAREEGRREGDIAGSLTTLEPIIEALRDTHAGDNVHIDMHAQIRDLVRRYGADAIERAAKLRSAKLQAAVADVIAELASAVTVPIDMSALERSTPNSPADVGGTGEPGGWTGGLTHPTTEKPRGKRVRREDSR